MDKKTLARLRGLGYEFDSAYDDLAELLEKSRADDAENKKKREEAKLEKAENEKQLVNNAPDMIGFDDEKGFFSQGTSKQIFRYHQALRYGKGTYGMDFNACCVMYFLQNYGLIPPVIKRKRFEYAFTPLKPQSDVSSKRNNTTKAQYIFIPDNDVNKDIIASEKGVIIKIVENLFDNLFPLGADAYLRGFEGGGAIFPHILGDENKLKIIFSKFYDTAKSEGYSFLRKNHNASGIKDLLDKGIKNKYLFLSKGILDKTYFQNNVIFIGLAHSTPMPGHYCIIVNVPIEKTLEGQKFWVYPADDPLYGKTNVYVPQKEVANLEKMANLIEENYGNFLIYPNCAIGV